VLFIEDDRFRGLTPRRSGDLEMPRFVESLLDLPEGGPMATPGRSQWKKARSAARKGDLSFEVSRDRADFAWFYERMFLPHVRNSFGDQAYIKHPAYVLSLLPTSELLFVTRAGTRIAGQMIEYREEIPFLSACGFLDGDQGLRRSVNQVMDYLSLTYLAEHGHRNVSIGASKAFLDDGVLHYKMLRGFRISPQRFYVPLERFCLSFPGRADAALRFLEHNPLLCLDAGPRHRALLAVTPGERSVGDAVADRLRDFSGFRVIHQWDVFVRGVSDVPAALDRIEWPVEGEVTVQGGDGFSTRRD
jgi:hypothetical protein